MKLTTKISNAYCSGLFTLFLLTDALGGVPSLRTLSRDLQIKTDGAITLLEAGKGAHAVHISQTFVGNSADGCNENDNGSNARILFATFMDPDTLQEKCGIFQRNVSPCFQDTVVVGCDLEANTATINLYVLDESFEKGMTTDNPKIGQCKAGQGDIIKRAIKVTETFDCLPLTEEEKSAIRFNTCSDSSDYCAEGTYCNFSTSDGYRCITGETNPAVCSCQEDEECFFSELKNGYFCRPFAQPGDSCGGEGIPDTMRTCHPKTSFCYVRDSCYNLQEKGTCVAFSSDLQCLSDADCEETTNWCDVSIGRCKPTLKKDDCCSSDNSCGDGLTCVKQYFDQIGLQATCRTICDSAEGGSSCDENEWCAFNDGYHGYYGSNDEFYLRSDFCKPFASGGEGCGFYTAAVFFERCNPETHFCFAPDSCYVADKGGICQPLGKPCKDTSDCDDSIMDWCDMSYSHCRPRLSEDTCCNPNLVEECKKGLVCAMGLPEDDSYFSQWPLCRPSSSTCEGQFCGGNAGINCDCICKDVGFTPICTDIPDDGCDPENGGVDCAGFCTCGGPGPVFEECNNEFCGGKAGIPCDCLCKAGYFATCVDEPSDECDPALGGADCGGICQCDPQF